MAALTFHIRKGDSTPLFTTAKHIVFASCYHFILLFPFSLAFIFYRFMIIPFLIYFNPNLMLILRRFVFPSDVNPTQPVVIR